MSGQDLWKRASGRASASDQLIENQNQNLRCRSSLFHELTGICGAGRQLLNDWTNWIVSIRAVWRIRKVKQKKTPLNQWNQWKMSSTYFSVNFHSVYHTVCTWTVEYTFSFGPCCASIHRTLEWFSPVQRPHFAYPDRPKRHCAATTNLYSMLTIRCCRCCFRAIYRSLCADRPVASETVVAADVAVVAVVARNFEAVASLLMVDADHERQRDRCGFVVVNLQIIFFFSINLPLYVTHKFSYWLVLTMSMVSWPSTMSDSMYVTLDVAVCRNVSCLVAGAHVAFLKKKFWTKKN